MTNINAREGARWIVGVDGSPDARAALQWAARMAAERGERVTPLGAWYLPLALVAMAGRRAGDVDRIGMTAEATVAADKTVDAIHHVEVIDTPVIAEGHPAPLLLERADENSVIVVGRRGINALKHRLLGSVSQYLATHADGPVVVVPADWSDRPCRKIVVGLDGSDHSIAALRWALEIATDDSEIIGLIAIDVAPWLSPELTAERHGDLVEVAEQRINDAANTVDPLHRATRSVVLHGPRQAFGQILGDADLIVVGPRGIGGLARAMLGSMATWLLSAATCPVAVVPSSSGNDAS